MADAYLKVKDNGAQGLALVREETDTSVGELKTQVTDFFCSEENATAVLFNQGTFNGYGEEANNNKAIRSYRYYNYFADRLYRINCQAGYAMSIRAWDDSGVHLGVLYDDGVFRPAGSGTTAQVARLQEYDVYKYPNYNIRIILYKYDSGGEFTNITPADATNISFTYAEVYGESFKREELTSLIGATKYRPFSGSFENESIGSSGWPKITRRIPNAGRGITSFIKVKAGTTAISYPGNGKTNLYFYEGSLENVISGALFPNSWSVEPVTHTFDRDGFVVGRWVNIDDTTNFDPNTSTGYMVVSDRATQNDIALTGKRISVMGDSISSFAGYSPTGALTYYPNDDVQSWQQMYWGRLATEYNIVLDTINAYAGTNVGTKWQTTDRVSFIEEERLSNLGTPDFIIIEGGTNDFGGNPLGEYPAWDTYTNLFEFRTAYAYLLNQLKIRYPSSRIICLTIMANNGYNTVSGHYPEKQETISQALATDTTPHFLYEFNDSIIELCKRYECYVCDISDLMNYYNASNEAIGGVHPKAETHHRIAKRIAEILKAF